MSAELDDFLPDPPVPARPSKADELVEEVVAFLRRADRAEGAQLAWEVSHAIAALQKLVAMKQPVTERQRDALLWFMPWVVPSVLALFHAEREVAFAKLGLDAMRGLAITASETDEERSSRHPDVFADYQSYARMLRNMLHNVVLLDDVGQRRHDRQKATLADILRGAA